MEWETASTAGEAASYNQCVPLGIPVKPHSRLPHERATAFISLHQALGSWMSWLQWPSKAQRGPPTKKASTRLTALLKLCPISPLTFPEILQGSNAYFKFWNYIYLVCVHVCMHTHMPQCKHGGHSTTYGSQLSLPISWILRTELKA